MAGLKLEFVAITAVSLLNSGMRSRPPVTAVLKSKLKFSEFIAHGLAEQMMVLSLGGGTCGIQRPGAAGPHGSGT